MRILLIAMCVLSIVINGLLGVAYVSALAQTNTLQQTLVKKQARINEVITSHNDVVGLLNERNAMMREQKAIITRLQDNITSYKSEINDYRDRLSQANYFVSRAKCTVMVDELKAYAATSNAEIKKPILNALQAVYRGKITSSNFTTYWDNNKSAMLTTIWGNNGSTKTIVSWSDSGFAIQTIYDVNSGCVMYTCDR